MNHTPTSNINSGSTTTPKSSSSSSSSNHRRTSKRRIRGVTSSSSSKSRQRLPQLQTFSFSSYHRKRSNNRQADRTKLWVALATTGIILCMIGAIILLKLADDHLMQTIQHHKQASTVHNSHPPLRGQRYSPSEQRQQRQQQHQQQNTQQRMWENPPPQTPSLGHVHPDTTNAVLPKNGKERVIHLLKKAGIDNIDDETLQRLPTWSQIVSLYGNGPKVYGLEDHCPAFQSRVPVQQRFVGPAGPFNSGTNLLAELLVRNCHNVHDPQLFFSYTKENHIRWQVPWGKHNPPFPETFRQSHRAGVEGKVVQDVNDVLSVVTIRDPYAWMKSMCRHSYSAQWVHNKDTNCPNLVRQQARDAGGRMIHKGNPVRVGYKQQTVVHESLAHMWNEFYEPYYFNSTNTNDQSHNAGTTTISTSEGFNRIIVRYEDLVFYPEETIQSICNCYGGQFGGKGGKFQYTINSAKFGESAHGKNEEKVGYVEAIIRYGNEKERLHGISQTDQEYATNSLRKDMMAYFGYKNPSLKQ